jgi:tRNA threonylcarbamoyl adenosine modification protein YeaZ
MLTLAIERSTELTSLALCQAGVCIYRRTVATPAARAPEWIAELADDLAAREIRPAAIARFVVGLGPGSFSGIRSALAAMQGLALPTGRPLLGLASAAALARSAGLAQGAERVVVLGDARRDRIWCVSYRLPPRWGGIMLLAQGGETRPTHTAADFTLLPYDALAAALPADALVVTADWERLGARLAAARPAGANLLAARCLPTAEDLAALFLADPEAASSQPLPLYLHPAVA